VNAGLLSSAVQGACREQDEISLIYRTCVAQAWLEGDILSGQDKADEVITCIVLGDHTRLPDMIDQLSRHLEREPHREAAGHRGDALDG